MIKTQAQALRAAQKILGKNAMVQTDMGAVLESDKFPYRAERDLLNSYSYDKQVYRSNLSRIASLNGILMRYRHSMGRVVMGMFFEVIAQGDTWDQVLEVVRRKQAEERERYKKLRNERSK